MATAPEASSDPQDGPKEITERPVPLHGNRLARAVLRLLGWRLEFDGLPSRQGVLLAYPHTSNWDFLIGMLAKWGIGMPVTIWGKDSLFKVPVFGAWLRWVGIVPINRKAPGGVVGAMTERMKAAAAQGEFFWMALAPEGSRSRGEGWRSGFYRVAVGAGVPIGIGRLDFAHRRVGITSFLQLSGNEAADMRAISRLYEGVGGCRPELANPITLK